MKLVCSQIELNNALQLVTRAVSARPTHPVLANVLMTADEGTDRLSLTGFDLNLGIQTSFKASVEKSGAITVPARLFGEIISKFSTDSSITLDIDENSQSVDINSLNGNYQMRGMSADDFPELPLVETDKSIKIKSNIFANAIRGTLFASSSDDSKQILTGVHLSCDSGCLEAAATDGHRLAILKLNNPFDDEENDNNFSVTLPSRSLRELERLLNNIQSNESITLFCDKGQVIFLSENQIVTTRTLEGTYPNYGQLIPEDFNRKICLNRKDFISALERVAVLADQHNNVIKITTDDQNNEKINISVDAQDVGTGKETLSSNIEGENIQIAFNVRYLIEGLKSINSDSVNILANGPTTPAIITPIDQSQLFKYLIMPVQIRT